MEKPKSALVMAMQDNDPALANRLISQYGTSKHLCDRLIYASADILALGWLNAISGYR
jgi:hypothetical protein